MEPNTLLQPRHTECIIYTYECTQIMSLQMKKVVWLCPYMDLSGFPLQIHVRIRNEQ